MKVKTILLSVVAVFIKSGVISIIGVTSLFVLTRVYYYTYLQGFYAGQISMQQYFSDFFATNQETSSTIDMKVTPTLQPKKNPAYSRQVSWGGPELWGAVNNKRQELGVNQLELREELCTIASIRLNELLELGKLDGHTGFSSLADNRSDLKWIFEKYGTVAEFLAVGGETPEETVSLWLNTLGHRKLLDGGEYVWGCIYSQNSFAVAIAAY